MLRINWDENHIGFLRERLAAKRSASQIASEMTKEFGILVTRSSVMGKCHRLNLQLDGQPRPKGRKPQPKKDKVVNLFKPSKPLPLPEPPPEGHVSLLELEKGLCHYPYGHSAPYKYCGAPSSGIYCEYHAQITFVEPVKRWK